MAYPSPREIHDAMHWPKLLQNMTKQHQEEPRHLIKFYFFFYCAVQEIRSNHVVRNDDLIKTRFNQQETIQPIGDFYNPLYQTTVSKYLLHTATVTPPQLHTKWTLLTKPTMIEKGKKRKFHTCEPTSTIKKQKTDKIWTSISKYQIPTKEKIRKNQYTHQDTQQVSQPHFV